MNITVLLPQCYKGAVFVNNLVNVFHLLHLPAADKPVTVSDHNLLSDLGWFAAPLHVLSVA